MDEKKIALVVLGSIVFAFQALLARQPLTFEERVKAQEAIERVYYNHRIWPKENPTPKPPFEQMVPKAQIEAEVTDYLKKSAALGQFWQRPIQPEQLQAEMDRMAKGTKDPATLKELFAALNNDPHLIAECLARPVLADRLIRNWYASDLRFHGETKAKAQAALASTGGDSLALCKDGHYQKMAYILSDSEESPIGRERMKHGEIPLDVKRFEKQHAQMPDVERSTLLRDTPEAFVLIRTTLKTKDRIEAEAVSFPKRTLEDWLKTFEPKEIIEAGSPTHAFAIPVVTATVCGEKWQDGILDDVPDPRYCHSAVWTGSEMIVCGGGSYYATYSSFTGGRYNPSTDSWTPVSTGPNCPSARQNHSAVWTGTEMIVWGGYYFDDYYGVWQFFDTGGRYNPSSDTWTPTSTGTYCPIARFGHTAVWTGTEMIIWGGYYYDYYNEMDNYLDSGGRYNPSGDTWTATSGLTGHPEGRINHTSVWTGTEMVVWGGTDSYGSFNTGGRYNPSTDSWTPVSMGAYCPAARQDHTAVWTDTEMIIWGGYLDTSPHYTNTGGRYNPATDEWAPISTGANCPSSRNSHTAIWTGTEMIIWGGYSDISPAYKNSGGRYAPSSGTWSPMSAAASCPLGRYGHSAVWTGTEMIVWGGMGTDNYNTGGRYVPSTDSWTPTSTGTDRPSTRYGHTAIWTGAEMIIWGGTDDLAGLNTGGRYNPSIDSWILTSTETNCPSARYGHTAVWTGTEMIVWGGDSDGSALNTGGRYNPDMDSWVPTTVEADCPSSRWLATAVWTGREMIVWGGYYFDGNDHFFNSGGRYNPSSDTWIATSTAANCPSARYFHTAVWTGAEMIVWGGSIYDTASHDLNTGGRYTPATNTWTPTSVGLNCPSARAYHTALWTGSEMIVWGGAYDGYNDLNTGGRYSPSNDAWSPTSVGANCPLARDSHTAVWTGAEMIAWGGYDYYANNPYLNDGGRYDPSGDTWAPTSTEGGCPLQRFSPTAVWTGSEMIVWGGYADGTLNSGGCYVPPIFISPSALPGGMIGMAYNQTLTASYTASPYTFAVTAGALPPGLTLFSGGGLIGAPTIGGSYSFTVTATDTSGCTGTRDYSITIAAAAPPGETAPGDALSTAETWINKNTVTWPANPLATGYNVYRGLPSDLPKLLTSDIDSCVKYNGSSTSAAANDDPTWVAGGFYWYLVTGTNANGEGPAGNATAGARIVNSSGTCP